MSDNINLQEKKAEILAELKASAKLEEADLEKVSTGIETFVNLVRETKSEAASRRIELKELNEKYAKLTSDFETEKKSLTDSKAQEIAALQQQIKDKETEYEPFKEKAAKYETYDAEKRAAIKESLGDKWLTSFDTIPLFDLEKIHSNLSPDNKLIGSDNGKGKKIPDKEFFTMDELKALTPQQLADKDTLAKANKSMEFHSKK